VAVVLTARRWSRSEAAASPAGAMAGDASLDPELSARLDDELRDLD
jgi:hypothetical protein